MTQFDAEMFVAAQGWRMDGPHSPERLQQALATAAELIRYANYATRGRSALTSAADAYEAVGALSVATSRLSQLMAQLSDYTSLVLPADQSLRHGDYQAAPVALSRQMATDTAFDAAVKLGLAKDNAGDLARAVGEAHTRLGYLYHDQEDQ
jgi:hypothetical protein